MKGIDIKIVLLAVMMAIAMAILNSLLPPSPQTTIRSDKSRLIRLATVPVGAEVTGLFKTENGELFFNVQHPSSGLSEPENKAAIGIVEGLNIDSLGSEIPELPVPESASKESGKVQLAKGTYHILGRAGDTFSGAMPFGLGAITNAAGDTLLKRSQNPDFNAFIPTHEDGAQGYLFTAWEDRPGTVSRIKIAKNAQGVWAVDTNDIMNIDFSGVQGTMINCFGTVSPWGTPLTSEENYEAENTASWNNAGYLKGYPGYIEVKLIQQYLGGFFPNPYRYGYIVEIRKPKEPEPVPVKLFALGRMAHENAIIMPDNKTVYLTDDGTDKAFYKFVADQPQDLTSGTLYAAKVSQDKTTDPAITGFAIEWIKLAHANSAEIEGWIAEYDGIDEGDFVASKTSYISQEEIEDWAAGKGKDDRYAFLESLRAAKAKGATSEFRKMEGIDINDKGVVSGNVPFMYVAVSEVEKGMSDEKGDIRLDKNRCGAVYRMRLESDYNISRMEPAIVGGEYNGLVAENQCPVDQIANPDNLIVLDDGRVLIGEDSNKHLNNMIWIFDPEVN